MSGDPFPWRSRPALLLLPLAVSGFPWMLPVAFARAEPAEFEGDGIVLALFGALSILLTAPLTGVVLAAITKERKLGFRRFAALYFLVSLPAIAFQLRYPSVSIVPGFLPHVDGGQFPIAAALLCTSLYTIYLIILYLTARTDFRRTFVVAALLFSVTLVITAKAIVP